MIGAAFIQWPINNRYQLSSIFFRLTVLEPFTHAQTHTHALSRTQTSALLSYINVQHKNVNIDMYTCTYVCTHEHG